MWLGERKEGGAAVAFKSDPARKPISNLWLDQEFLRHDRRSPSKEESLCNWQHEEHWAEACFALRYARHLASIVENDQCGSIEVRRAVVTEAGMWAQISYAHSNLILANKGLKAEGDMGNSVSKESALMPDR